MKKSQKELSTDKLIVGKRYYLDAVKDVTAEFVGLTDESGLWPGFKAKFKDQKGSAYPTEPDGTLTLGGYFYNVEYDKNGNEILFTL